MGSDIKIKSNQTDQIKQIKLSAKTTVPVTVLADPVRLFV